MRAWPSCLLVWKQFRACCSSTLLTTDGTTFTTRSSVCVGLSRSMTLQIIEDNCGIHTQAELPHCPSLHRYAAHERLDFRPEMLLGDGEHLQSPPPSSLPPGVSVDP